MTIQSLAILAHNLATLINSGETKNKNTPTATATPTQMPLLKTKPEKTETEKRFLNVAAHRLEREGTIAEREWPVISPCVCVCEPSETNRQVSLTFFAAKQHTHTHTAKQFCVHFFQLRLLLSLLPYHSLSLSRPAAVVFRFCCCCLHCLCCELLGLKNHGLSFSDRNIYFYSKNIDILIL